MTMGLMGALLLSLVGIAQAGQTEQEGYNIYRLYINSVKNPGSANCCQIAEIQLFDGDKNIATGGTVKARGENSPGETAGKAFDGNSNSKWLDFKTTDTWIQYQFPDNKKYNVTSYSITSANDEPNRDPKDFKLQGSNDGISWTDLDVRTNEEFPSRFQTKTYNLKTLTAEEIAAADEAAKIAAEKAAESTRQGLFNIYRLYINSVKNPGSTDICQIAEIQLFDGDKNIATGGTVKARGENSPGETAGKAFDGNSKSKWLDFKGTNTWIRYQFPDNKKYNVTSYSITSANDEPNRDPKDFKLQGSNDGISWTDLDVRTNEEFSSRWQTKTYTLSPIAQTDKVASPVTEQQQTTGIAFAQETPSMAVKPLDWTKLKEASDDTDKLAEESVRQLFALADWCRRLFNYDPECEEFAEKNKEFLETLFDLYDIQLNKEQYDKIYDLAFKYYPETYEFDSQEIEEGMTEPPSWWKPSSPSQAAQNALDILKDTQHGNPGWLAIIMR